MSDYSGGNKYSNYVPFSNISLGFCSSNFDLQTSYNRSNTSGNENQPSTSGDSSLYPSNNISGSFANSYGSSGSRSNFFGSNTSNFNFSSKPFSGGNSSFSNGQQQNQWGSNNFWGYLNSQKKESSTNNKFGNWQIGSLVKNNNQSSYKSNSKEMGEGQIKSKHVPFKKFREHFAKRKNNPLEDKTPAPTIFMGRDQSYPDELNNLMNPFSCGVCNAPLNSIKSANIHYESKTHDKHLLNWLKKNYSDKGLQPPEIHRFVSEAGPFRCELCKLDLTSPQHALQHYNGRRHKQAAFKVSMPTGVGYYDVMGNWVQTGTIIDENTGKEKSYIMVNTSTGSEPVVLHSCSNIVAGVKRPAAPQKEIVKKIKEDENQTLISENEKNKKEHQNDTNSTTTTTTAIADNQPKPISTNGQETISTTNQTPEDALRSLECKLCSVTTTCYDQMVLHLKGIRHTKKLRSLGETNPIHKSPITILESLNTVDFSDVSMYRTPSGSYYCKCCNMALKDVALLKKHITSKPHLAEAKKSGSEKANGC